MSRTAFKYNIQPDKKRNIIDIDGLLDSEKRIKSPSRIRSHIHMLTGKEAEKRKKSHQRAFKNHEKKIAHEMYKPGGPGSIKAAVHFKKLAGVQKRVKDNRLGGRIRDH